MAAASDYLLSVVLNATLNQVQYTSVQPFLALYTTGPSANDVGGVEVTGGSYTRQPLYFTTPDTTTHRVTNATTVAFTGMPACTLTGMGIRDDPVAGNLLYWLTFTPAIGVTGTTTFSIGVGELAVTLV